MMLTLSELELENNENQKDVDDDLGRTTLI